MVTSIQIIFHEKLNTIQCFCGFVGRNHQCEKAIQGKIIFRSYSEEDCSKCQDKIKETNITKKGGRQAGTVILFAEHVMRKYLIKFAHIVFVVFAILP